MSETHEHDALDAHLGRAPTRPDVPPPRRNGAKLALAILGGLVVLGIVGSLLGRGADAGETIAGPGTSASPAAPSQDNGGSDVTPEMIVDVMGPEKVGEFCSNYDAIGDYDTALAAFSKGYTQPDPPARDVFDELLSRC
jgi:hypothetical protein